MAGKISRVSGFSLVEVTLAVGIAAFVLIGMMAMLGEAMSGARVANSRTTGADIGARLIGEVHLSDWESLPALETGLRYFDDFGEELEGASAEAESVFSARVVLSEEGPVLASSGEAEPNEDLKKVTVIVCDRPGPVGGERIEGYLDGDFPRDLQFFHSVVVNMEK